MSIQTWCIIIAALTVAVGLSVWLRPRLRRARAYIKNVCTCGYLAPPPTARGLRWLKRTAGVLTFIQVGRIKYIGRENLDLAPGPMIVTPNHPHWADPGVLALALDRPARYMAAGGVFKFAWGLGGLVAGPMGAFCVDLDAGKGGPAREAAVKVLTSGQTLGMFPEGWAYLDGVMGRLKKGAVHIAQEASEILQQKTYIVPTFIRYGKYPGSWIRKLPPQLEYLFVFINFWLYRRGATVVIGKPIAVTDFPANDDEATEFLRQQIVALDPAGKDGRP
jgi:1-acyl-sn-glycerol-3-phosphate acyltransferase